MGFLAPFAEMKTQKLLSDQDMRAVKKGTRPRAGPNHTCVN